MKAEAKQFKKDYAKEFNSLDDFDREEYRIGKEAMSVKSQMMADPGNYDAYEKKMADLERQYNELNAARKAWKAANKKK